MVCTCVNCQVKLGISCECGMTLLVGGLMVVMYVAHNASVKSIVRGFGGEKCAVVSVVLYRYTKGRFQVLGSGGQKEEILGEYIKNGHKEEK